MFLVEEIILFPVFCFITRMSSIADVILNLQFSVQRYGPPPSYPQLKIPGLNAPIPPGAKFGYHPGGWGKPPVDEVSSKTFQFIGTFYILRIIL